MVRALLSAAALAFLMTACATPRSPSAVERGAALYHHGRWAAAAAMFEEALRTSPTEPDSYPALTITRPAVGDRPRATADVNRALTVDSPHAKPLPTPEIAQRRTHEPGAVRPGEAGVTVVPGPASDPAAAVRQDIGAKAPDAEALAIRGVTRALDGDRTGAVTDLRRALAAEDDLERRQRVQQLLDAVPRGLLRADDAPSRVGLEGIIRDVDGSMLTLAVPAGREVIIDLSAMRLEVAPVLWPGRSVSLAAQRQSDGTLLARSVTLTYGPWEVR